jgi:N-acetylglucosaminyldiphosphoundecaprenol N-acetyl-beta-D-mannosaminyltransferase
VGGYGVLCNVHVLMSAGDDPAVRDAVGQATWVFADGAPIAWLQRRSGTRTAQRVTGSALMWRVLDEGRQHGLRHALFGSTPTVLDRLATAIEGKLPGAEIVVAISPEFAPGAADSEQLLAELAAARPDVVWCALGAPKQELWMQRHAERLVPAILVGVGAAFDFHAGTKRRAPVWMQRAGLEWFHRLLREPRRLAGRYAQTNTRFVGSVARTAARRHA